MSLKDVFTWNGRWQALQQTIEDMLEGMPGPNILDRQPTIVGLLYALRDFGRDQYCFFRDGFADPPSLVASSHFPAEYALRQTLDQIAFDLAVIERARNQRTHGLSANRARAALARADILAYQALCPAIAAGMIKNMSVLTYFQKASAVRVIPYAHVALIGIPYTCQDPEANARDFLAIPHEVGHYLYWHGRKQDVSLAGTLRSALRNSSAPSVPDWILRWREEIFADVYGCLVAGPAIAYDFQELMLDNLNFSQDDGDHPMAAVRPTIYTQVLSAIKKADGTAVFADAPAQLDVHWQGWLAERDPSGYIMPKGAEASVSLATANDYLQTTIQAVKSLLGFDDDQIADTIWTKDEQFNIAAPYEEFQSWLNGLPDSTTHQVPEVAIEQNFKGEAILRIEPITATPAGINSVIHKSGETQALWFNVLKLAVESGIQLPPEMWSIGFTNGGWAVSGPEGNTNPPG